jgi:hypothetical protein
MLIDSWLCGVCFSVGNGSKVIIDADVGTSGPSRWTTRIHNGWSLQIMSIFVRNFEYQKRMCGDGCVEFKLKCIPSILVRLKN